MTWEEPNPVGVDIGVSNIAVLSDGTFFGNDRAYRRMEEEFKEESRKLSSVPIHTKQYRKTRSRLNHKYRKMVNRRKETVERISSEIVKNHTVIVMEDLSVNGLRSISQSRTMTKSYNDASLGRLRQRICDKAMEAGRMVVFVNPKNTSQRCSSCGRTVHKELSDRVHDCPFCGLVMDRDLNASLNILRLGSTRDPFLVQIG